MATWRSRPGGDQDRGRCDEAQLSRNTSTWFMAGPFVDPHRFAGGPGPISSSKRTGLFWRWHQAGRLAKVPINGRTIVNSDQILGCGAAAFAAVVAAA